MRVLVTGASGHIASALVPELLGAGHDVVGLARSETAAAAVEALGAKVQHGSLDDLGALTEAAAACDGVIHLAYRHDLLFSGDIEGATAAHTKAVGAMASALDGTGKPFVGVNGTLILAMAGITGRPGTEEDTVAAGPAADRENVVIALAERGVRASVVRLAPTVHSDLDKGGFVPVLVGFARHRGAAVYVGDGSNRWPAVSTYDAARLLRLAFESAPAGARLHGVAEEGIPFREIAEAIASNLDLPAKSVTSEEAGDYLGPVSLFAHADNPTSSDLTRQRFDWQPGHPGLIADINEGHYFS
ncbi:MAG: SDR family oxidoreductase [Acidimicrobiales bacterium]